MLKRQFLSRLSGNFKIDFKSVEAAAEKEFRCERKTQNTNTNTNQHKQFTYVKAGTFTNNESTPGRTKSRLQIVNGVFLLQMLQLTCSKINERTANFQDILT